MSSTTMWWIAATLYGVGIAVGVVAACSAHRYREARDEKEMATQEPFVLGERYRREVERNQKLLAELVYAIMWPIALIVWAAFWVIVFAFEAACIPGERKASHDGLI